MACEALEAFSVCLSEDDRRHDFLLGRMNGEGFLSKFCCLPVNDAAVQSAIPVLFSRQKRRLACDFKDHASDMIRPILPI